MRVDLSLWMKKIGDDTPVFSLNIPGTHDSVTQFVQLSHLARCQNKSIFEQLYDGIRCIDIRVKSNGDRLCLVHGIAKVFTKRNPFSKQMDMADVIKMCFDFLKDKPSETVILQFKNDNNLEMEHCFDLLYNKYIKSCPDRWYLENRIPNISEVRGKIILLRRCDIYSDREYPLGCGIDFSKWEEQDEVCPNPLCLDTNGAGAFLIQDRFGYKPNPKWYNCVKPFLDSMTPFGGQYIINYLSTAGGFKGPKRNSDFVNKEFLNYHLDKNKYYGIIYIDFPTQDMIEKIVQLNF